METVAVNTSKIRAVVDSDVEAAAVEGSDPQPEGFLTFLLELVS
jgi:hypothetical protein